MSNRNLACEAVRESLAALLHDELDPQEEQAVRDHLNGCHHCSDEMEAYQNLLGRLLEERPSEVPERAWETICERIATDGTSAPGETALNEVRPAPLTIARRRRAIWIGAAAAAVILLVLFASLSTGPVVGTVSVGGSVSIDGGSTLRTGHEVRAGNVLATGSTGRITLSTKDGSEIDMGVNSSLKITGKKELGLAFGTLTAHVTPHDVGLKIATPQAAIEAVGTEFDVAASPSETKLNVVRGIVRCTTAKETKKIGASEWALADASGAIKVWPAALAGMNSTEEAGEIGRLVLRVETISHKERFAPGEPIEVEVSVASPDGLVQIGRLGRHTATIRYYLRIQKNDTAARGPAPTLLLSPDYRTEPGETHDDLAEVSPGSPYRFTVNLAEQARELIADPGTYLVKARYYYKGVTLDSENEITITINHEPTGS